MNITKAASLLTLCVAALATGPLHAQESHSLDLTIHGYGISIGDSRRVTDCGVAIGPIGLGAGQEISGLWRRYHGRRGERSRSGNRRDT